jgi:hypothetical protein
MIRKVSQFILLPLILLTFHAESFSQGTSQFDQNSNKWVFGGNFGLGFSTYGANISISPQIGYRITPAWEFGTRLTYNYYSYKDVSIKFSTNNFGGGFYSTYDIYRGIFAQVENEILSYEKVFWDQVNPDVLNHERVIIHSIFIGGGYRQYLSGRAFMGITVLYNLNETPDTPYSNPLFRVGFGIGI